MLGMQIAATGALSMLVALVFIRGPWPGPIVGGLLLTGFFGGLVAVIGGFLMTIWA